MRACCIQQRVLVHARDGRSYRGVLASATKPIHLLNEGDRQQPPQVAGALSIPPRCRASG